MEETLFNVSVYFKIAAIKETGISLMELDCNLVLAFMRAVELTELTYVAVVPRPIQQLAYIAVKFLSMSVTPQQKRYCMWEYTLIKEVNT